MGLEFNECEIDRVCYIGEPTIDQNTKEECKSMIVEFKSWKLRTVFCKICPKSYFERKKKREVKFSICFGLTKRR